jgi:hypothetical protein
VGKTVDIASAYTGSIEVLTSSGIAIQDGIPGIGYNVSVVQLLRGRSCAELNH